MAALTRGIARSDVLVAIMVGLAQVIGTGLAGMHQPTVGLRPLDLGGYLLLATGPLLLIWRRRNPPAVLIMVLTTTVAYALLDYPRGPIYLSLVVAFFHTVLAGYRTIAYPTLIVGYLSLTLLASEVTGHGRPGLPFLGGVAAWLLVLLVGSELVRIRQAYAAERRRRRRESELTREEEARRRASEERLEIARELHDVMAHSISLINVQAGVALELMDRRPEQARQALTAIKAASKDALLEVQGVLASLRGGAPPPTTVSTPYLVGPGRSGLDQLIARARLAGVEVHCQVDGEAVPLPAGLDQAAGRIVQEALTNVARHAGGGPTASARLRVSYRAGAGSEPSELVIVVDNDIDRGEGDGEGGGSGRNDDSRDDGCSGVCLDRRVGAVEPGTGGRGIAGMRERAQAWGGTLAAGPRAGGFRVEAHLPIVENDSERTVVV